MTRAIRGIAGLLLALFVAGCGRHAPPAVAVAPKYPGYLKPHIPVGLNVAPDLRQLHEDGWQRLQRGDTRGAARDFSDILKRAPDFYPADAGLGYAAMADRQFKQAVTRFAAAVARDSAYLPALRGQVDAALAAGDDLASIVAIDQLLKIEPAHDDLRNRVELLRLRTVQTQIELAARERSAGHMENAQQILERALMGSPANPVLLRELAEVELALGKLEPADAHARSAVQLDSGDAESLAVLGGVLEAQGRFREAARAYGGALAIDPRPAWKEKRDSLDAKANFEALPAEYRAIPSAATVTRGQLAALIGIELKAIVDAAPKRSMVIMTDVRTHWAAPWILPVTQAGVMDAQPNHTFQPNAIVRRGEWAQVVSQMLLILSARRPAELTAWRAARPQISDVPASHASYRAVAVAIASGVVPLQPDGTFALTRAVTGADLVSSVARLKALAGR